MPVVLPLDEQLCFSLYTTSMAIQRTYKPMLDRLGITYPQYLVLHTLVRQDKRTIGSIAERLTLPPSTVTPLVQRLDAAGLVSRARNLDDERLVEVRLTPQGQEVLESCHCLADALVARSGVTLDELMVLNRQVQRFRDALAAGGVEPNGEPAGD